MHLSRKAFDRLVEAAIASLPEEFARWIEAGQVQGTREVTFIIGGPAGLDPAFSQQAHLRLSLGKMTWTHEMVRVLLLEQIYRALTILRNIPYHK